MSFLAFPNEYLLNLQKEYPYYAAFVNFVQVQQLGGQSNWGWQLWDSLYRTSWVAERIVTCLADDMTDKWRVFEHQDPEVIKIRTKFEKENNIARIINSVLKQARLYGGACVLPIIKGRYNPEDMSKPFDFSAINVGDLINFQVMCRYDFAQVGGINRDYLLSPEVFGDYELYDIIRIENLGAVSTSGGTSGSPVSDPLPQLHRTWMGKVHGTEVFYYQMFASGGWGDSVLQRLINKIPQVEEANHLMFEYLDLFNIDEIKIPNLSAQIQSGNVNLFKSYIAFRDKMKQAKLRFMDSTDEMNRNTINSIQNTVPSFDSQLQFLCGASGIPITRILGTSVAGWSTGDNELTQYYDLISQKQNYDLRMVLSFIDEIIERSLFGKKMSIEYRFLPKRELTEKERSEINKIKQETIVGYVQAKIMTPKVAAMNIKDEFTGIDTEYIDSLDEDFLDYPSLDMLSTQEDEEDAEREEK